ncbi:MAG: nucleotidyltransferase family protein [Candidatus Tectomicrobia bacterium]|nr:nucleotidyltransferase family protein [Candidatus Tectomicrobia bacterium]
MTHPATQDELLYTLLRGAAVPWPKAADSMDEDRFLKACVAHGVTPLVYQHLYRSSAWPAWPAALRTGLAHYGRVQTAVAVLYEQDLVKVLAGFAAHGIQVLLMKGVPLAYTHYPDPALRPHCDTDLLIQPQDRTATHRLLTAQGYAPLPGVSGGLISHQCTYVKEGTHGVRHAYDVHWKISNPYAFADCLSVETLQGAAVAITALGPHARALSTVHALILACIHRIAHHQHEDRLIWLYDIHLLARSMSCAEWAELGQLALDTRLQEVCRLGLQLVRRHFGTALPQDIMARLKISDRPLLDAPGRPLRRSHPRRLHRLAAELCALPSWRHQWHLLWEHAFPPAAYILHRYAATRRSMLPMLYLHRGVRGLWRLLHRV